MPNPLELPGVDIARRTQRPDKTAARKSALTAGLAAVALLAGCGGGGNVPAGLGPVAPPNDFAKLEGAGFTIAAPDTFTPQNQRSTNGEPKLTLNARQRRPGEDPTLVAVIRDVKPQSSAVEQMRVLEDVKRQVQATDISRQEVRWPGARNAVMVGWTQSTNKPPEAPGPPARNLQLAVQVTDTLIINVVATAPAEFFDDTQVATVLRTFRLTRAS